MVYLVDALKAENFRTMIDYNKSKSPDKFIVQFFRTLSFFTNRQIVQNLIENKYKCIELLLVKQLRDMTVMVHTNSEQHIVGLVLPLFIGTYQTMQLSNQQSQMRYSVSDYSSRTEIHIKMCRTGFSTR